MIIRVLLLLAVVVAVLWLARGGTAPRAAGATPAPPPAPPQEEMVAAAIAACTCRAARHCRAAAASSAAKRTVRPSSRPSVTERRQPAWRADGERGPPTMTGGPPSPPARAARHAAAERTPPERPTRRASAARRRGRAVDESWFGAVGMGADTQWRDEGLADDAESRFGDGWADAAGVPADSRFLSGQAQRIVGAGQTAFERIYRAFISARAALGLALLLTLGVSGLFGVLPGLPVLLLCLGYAALSISMWLLPRFRRPAPAARAGAPAQPAVAGDDRRRHRLLHRAARAGARRGPQLRRAAGAAGADGRRAHAAPDGAGDGGGRHAGPARRGLARLCWPAARRRC